MTSYEIFKIMHVATALISIIGFIMRGIWMMCSSTLLQQRWVKVVPHINDTILLLSAIALVFITSLYPGPIQFINVKIIALVLYIVLGTIALKRGKTMRIRIIAWVLAILVFMYIFAVANSKTILLI